jgi:hypothetical protein
MWYFMANAWMCKDCSKLQEQKNWLLHHDS